MREGELWVCYFYFYNTPEPQLLCFFFPPVRDIAVDARPAIGGRRDLQGPVYWFPLHINVGGWTDIMLRQDRNADATDSWFLFLPWRAALYSDNLFVKTHKLTAVRFRWVRFCMFLGTR